MRSADASRRTRNAVVRIVKQRTGHVELTNEGSSLGVCARKHYKRDNPQEARDSTT